MQTHKTIPIVDLFAGPGGLGEGFSSIHNGRRFQILTSIEMDSEARKTLRLRAFFRLLKSSGKSLASYYKFCNGLSENPFDDTNLAFWERAGQEAIQAELGSLAGNALLNESLKKNQISESTPWVLIGGPPCQAYSMAARGRQSSKKNFKLENDKRTFLYMEYLKVVRDYAPAVFVMENVKGILSSKVKGDLIFHSILKDLAEPFSSKAGGKHQYKIYSLVTGTHYEHGMDPESIDKTDFIIESEKFGIPQARHRVILLGIRDDLVVTPKTLKPSDDKVTVKDAIGTLPRLRSAPSKRSGEIDTFENWKTIVKGRVHRLLMESKNREELEALRNQLKMLQAHENFPKSRGANRFPITQYARGKNNALNDWYLDDSLNVVLNHESREHKSEDICRYIYASAFAKIRGKSPRGIDDFDLECLTPDHKNWKTGKFKDRFRVQLANKPADTIVSHLSNDGHQFIHYDEKQARTITVREAARLQTFPDNYFFQGARSAQYRQVGNAVPPLLARQIAHIVDQVMKAHS